MSDLQRLIDAADHDGLLLEIDRRCATRDWDGLVDLARRCRDAVELGRQLWGVAQHVEYRLALEAPPSYAGAVLRPGAARFALGPLTEVAAERFTWSELAPWVADPIARQVVAAERALRGEDLQDEPEAETADLPLAHFDFEPDYPRPRYRDRHAQFPPPPLPMVEDATRLGPATARTPAPRDPTSAALLATCQGWFAGGAPVTARACGVEGADAAAAIRALAGAKSELVTTALSGAQTLAWLQWAGAGGGYRGRRRGGAAGRFAAWWALTEAAGLEWPDDAAELPVLADQLAGALAELSFLRWWPEEPEAGLVLRLAVSDPLDEVAWAVEVVDPPPEE